MEKYPDNIPGQDYDNEYHNYLHAERFENQINTLNKIMLLNPEMASTCEGIKIQLGKHLFRKVIFEDPLGSNRTGTCPTCGAFLWQVDDRNSCVECNQRLIWDEDSESDVNYNGKTWGEWMK